MSGPNGDWPRARDGDTLRAPNGRPATAFSPVSTHAPSPEAPAALPGDGPAAAPAPLPGPALSPAALAARRDSLAAEVAQLQWDLGGLAYEMAVRDHFRLDVLVRAAARMQRADSELGEVDRLLHLTEHGAAGTCPSCGALRSRAAAFCWSCGTELLEPIGTGR
jgi:hypothetical protein